MNSATRGRFAPVFGPDLERRRSRYIWLGTDLVFDAFKFYILDTPAGVMQVHGYPYSEHASTFILEMHEDVWRRAGFATWRPRTSRRGRATRLHRTHPRPVRRRARRASSVATSLVANNSRWTTFTTVRCQTWRHENVVLLGDAAHTAHFSIGSGTKLAMEDALALAACLHEQPGVAEGLAAYEAERRPVVASTQRAAQASLEWFENIGQYAGQDPHQFAFNIVTRSRRVTYDNLRLRDPEFVAGHGPLVRGQRSPGRRGAQELERRNRCGRRCSSRSGSAAWSWRTGSSSPRWTCTRRATACPATSTWCTWARKALGGAGLVMTEMVCVSPTGRITPGCTGIYTTEQEESWRRVTSFVHERTRAKIGIQIGHSGRKGSTRLMWEGMDDPLPEGNWEVCGPSPVPYKAGSQTPR